MLLPIGITAWSCLRGLGAVEEFVRLKSGTASAAKTTMVEIVKVSEDGRDRDCRVEMVFLWAGNQTTNTNEKVWSTAHTQDLFHQELDWTT